MRDALLAQAPNTAWLVAIGPLTNIASLIATFPEVVDRLAGLSIMGGAVGGGFANAPLGKDGDSGELVPFPSRWAEFNTWVSWTRGRSRRALGARDSHSQNTDG